MTRGGSRTAVTSKMEHFVIIVNGWNFLIKVLNYYYKELHLRCCSSPRSVSNDVNNNGIVNLLHFRNMKIHLPGLTFKKLTKMKDGHYVDWSDCVYRYSFLVDLSPKLLHFNFTQNVEYNLQRPYGGIADDDKGMKHLSSEDQ